MARTLAKALRIGGGHAPGLAQTVLLLIAAWIAFQGLRIGEGSADGVATSLWIVPHAVAPGLLALLGFNLASREAEGAPRAAVIAVASRAIPSLAVAVLGAALVVGPLVTTAGSREYFFDSTFGSYFLNLIGWPQFALPGVFEFSEYPVVVNEALWLTPCVALTLMLWASSRGRWRFARLVPWGAMVLIGLAYAAGEVAGLIASPAASSLRGGYVGGAMAAVVAGQLGVFAYRWRERIPVGWPLLTVTLGALGAIAVLGPDVAEIPGTLFAIAVLASYIALASAAATLPGAWIAQRAAPLTYGAILFPFPLQQAIADAGLGRGSAPLTLALGVPLALLAAFMLDWLLVRSGFALPQAPPTRADIGFPGPIDRSGRSWRQTLHRSSGGLIVALAVAAIAVLIIAITLVALQKDPVGV